MMEHQTFFKRTFALWVATIIVATPNYGLAQDSTASQDDVISGTSLKIVSVTNSDISRAAVVQKVQNWLAAFNRLSPGTQADLRFDPKSIELYLTLNPQKERMWYIRCPEWKFSLESETGRLITFKNLTRKPLTLGQTRSQPIIPAIAGDSAAKTILKRYAAVIPLQPKEKLVSPVFAREGDPRYTDGDRAGRVFAKIALPTPGGHPFHFFFQPYGHIEVDPIDGALLSFSRVVPVRYMTTRVVLSAEEAVARVQNLVPNKALNIPEQPKLFYVVPDIRLIDGRFTQANKDRFTDWPPKVYLAWVVHIRKTGPRGTEVRIDAQTGEQLAYLPY